ncbi:MAG: hypothetical protein PHQ59_01550 [Candidatus Daviesbacteria bacterium]|nr:hypothetical protein [Candidatus Daviesbacteria bacterium]
MGGERIKPLILAVNKDPDILTLITMVLEENYRIIEARSGLEGLDFAQRCPLVKTIIVDVYESELGGLNIIDILGVLPESKKIPLLLMGADKKFLDIWEQRPRTDTRMIECLDMPFNLQDLNNKLDSLINPKLI